MQCKTCTKCQRVLPISKFPLRRDRGDGTRPRSHCNDCHNAWQQTPTGAARTRDARFARKYGITSARFDEMWAEQGGLCAVCGDLLTESNWHLDHNHRTGQVRKILCVNCNMGLGQFKDSSARLFAAARYLRGYELAE